MNRPFVVCHMLCSMDGKIEGSFMAALEALPGLAEYGKLRGFYNCTATLYGTTTMEEGYSDGLAPKLDETGEEYPMEDYIAPSDVKNCIVSLDPAGILGFSSPYAEKKGRPRTHVIEVLTEQVKPAYGFRKQQGRFRVRAGILPPGGRRSRVYPEGREAH